MFFGHIGVALAAKPIAPKAPTGVLIIAATLIDTLCGLFIITGIEWVNKSDGTSSIPWSHGLFMSVIWTLLTFGIVYLITKNWKMSLVIGLLVFSHWVLDFISHPMGMGKVIPADLPLLFEGSPKVGLGLYNSIVAAFVTDFGLLVGGILLFLKTSKSKDRTGIWSFVVLILFLGVFPLTMALPEKLSIIATLLTLLYLPLGFWVDRHRSY